MALTESEKRQRNTESQRRSRDIKAALEADKAALKKKKKVAFPATLSIQILLEIEKSIFGLLNMVDILDLAYRDDDRARARVSKCIEPAFVWLLNKSSLLDRLVELAEQLENTPSEIRRVLATARKLGVTVTLKRKNP